ncbi:MAG: ABC transporter substrate-binding protein, partial [Pseudomonas sp.]|nr:ABC transporter substrate-binding protein [Pseudomonas sp.]
MRRILNDLKIMLLANLWLVPVLAALVGAVFYLVAPPPPMSARMVTGPQGGAYAQFAERLQAELAKEGFTLELQPSRGASDSLAQLLADEPEVQLGIVQSGLERTLSAAQRERLSSLGALYHEPLWLFYRADLELATLHDLRPLRLGLGTQGSGTALLSQALLQASGIATEDYPPHWQALGGGPAVRALQAGELDGLFLVAPAENPLLQQ